MRRWQLSRRTFLRGTGTVLALPLLDAMIPTAAKAQATPPLRFLYYYVPCGKRVDTWSVGPLGSLNLSLTLQPLAAVRSHINVISNLWNYGATAQADGAGDHARGTAAFLTCAHPNKSDTDIRNGVSVDQIIAARYAGQTQIRSLQLGLESGGNSGNCDSGYGCAYSNNVSWADATTPLSKITDPLAAFNQFVLEPDESALAAAHALGRRQRVVDLVRADAKRLETRLGVRDKQKLDQYMTSVDELDTRLTSQRSDLEGGAVCQGTAPVAGGDTLVRVRNMIDVMVLAMQCDVTRVITYMRGNGGSGRSGFAPGVAEGHHDLSHHEGNTYKLDQYAKVNTWDVQQFAYLVQRMAETDDGNGKLIDHVLAFYSSEIGDGNAHNHDRLPVIVAGHANGQVTGGRHIVAPDRTPIANLFATMTNMVGGGNRFADSTGLLSALTS
ncbi:MAG: DUF1552 domain-containing protein [Myxococcota bacterium]|nr:DUF1552 domain-containing protein [Myxococcota bacterium]